MVKNGSATRLIKRSSIPCPLSVKTKETYAPAFASGARFSKFASNKRLPTLTSSAPPSGIASLAFCIACWKTSEISAISPRHSHRSSTTLIFKLTSDGITCSPKRFNERSIWALRIISCPPPLPRSNDNRSAIKTAPLFAHFSIIETMLRDFSSSRERFSIAAESIIGASALFNSCATPPAKILDERTWCARSSASSCFFNSVTLVL